MLVDWLLLVACICPIYLLPGVNSNYLATELSDDQQAERAAPLSEDKRLINWTTPLGLLGASFERTKGPTYQSRAALSWSPSPLSQGGVLAPSRPPSRQRPPCPGYKGNDFPSLQPVKVTSDTNQAGHRCSFKEGAKDPSQSRCRRLRTVVLPRCTTPGLGRKVTVLSTCEVSAHLRFVDLDEMQKPSFTDGFEERRCLDSSDPIYAGSYPELYHERRRFSRGPQHH